MTSPGFRPKKSGFMASLQSAMTPVVPVDNGGPIVRPRGVTTASVLALIAGVLFVLGGVISISSISSQISLGETSLSNAVRQCTDAFGGIGTAVPSAAPTPTAGVTTPIPLTALPSSCRSLTQTTFSPSFISAYRESIVTFSVATIIIGLAAGLSGWFLRDGRKWTRRALIGVVILELIVTFFLHFVTLYTLLSTLLVVIALAMTFVGQGAAYFMVVALRKRQH